MSAVQFGLLMAFTLIAPCALGLAIAAAYERDFRRKYPAIWEMQRRRRMSGRG